MRADQKFAFEPTEFEVAALSASMSHFGDPGNKGNQ